MIGTLKKVLAQNVSNITGWRTNRRIIVFESDDWGSIRMPSYAIYEQLLRDGIRVDKCTYNRIDSLESEEDLSSLFDVLVKFRDKYGNHPVITANTCVANPDFDKIRASDYKIYYYEPSIETLKRYPFHKNVFALWKLGIKENIFYPQFHGREHVNIPLWLKLLQENNEVFIKAFDLGLWGIGPEVLKTSKIHIQAAFDASDESEILNQHEIIKEGLNLFQSLFGYRSRSFIANNFIWDKSLNATLAKSGTEFIQGMKYQILPVNNRHKRELIFHFTGEMNDLGQVYTVRNCNFDPGETPDLDNMSNCLGQIKNAFFWKKPAIISTHRLNYIGSIDKSNRTKNLSLFKQLIHQIIKNWPDVEFRTSVELGDIIFNSYNNDRDIGHK